MSAESNQSIKSQKSSNNLASIAVVIVVILVLVVSGLVYQFLLVPNQVQTSINKNIETNNRILDKAGPAVNDINQKATSVSNELKSPSVTTDNINKQVTELIDQTSSLDALVKEIDSAKSNLDDGNNNDTRDFKKLITENLESASGIISDSKKLIEYQSCVVQKYLAIIESFNKLGEQFAQVTEEDLSPILAGALYPEQIGVNLGAMKSCFVGEYAKYLTPTINTGLDESIAYINKVNDEFLNIASPSIVENTEQETSAQQLKLINTILAVPSFLVDDEPIKEAIDMPVKDLEKKLVEMNDKNKKVNDKVNEIKSKYNLK